MICVMKKSKTFLTLLGAAILLQLSSGTLMVGAGELQQQPAPTYTRMPPPTLSSPTSHPATETPEPPMPTSPAPTALPPQSSPLPVTPASTLASEQMVAAILPESGEKINSPTAWVGGLLGGGMALVLAMMLRKKKRQS